MQSVLPAIVLAVLLFVAVGPQQEVLASPSPGETAGSLGIVG